MTFDGTQYVCDHCEEVIEPTGGYDWMGGAPAPGEPQQHFHFSRKFPECRARSGADGDAGLPLEDRITLALAESFTAPGPDGQLPQFRVNQGMMKHFRGPDGFPSMAPVTPREIAGVVMRVLKEAGAIP